MLILKAHFKSSVVFLPKMKIGEVARKAGIRTSAIRFYEKAGVLPPAADKMGNDILHPTRSYSWPSSNSPERQASQSQRSSYCFMASGKALQLQRDGDS